MLHLHLNQHIREYFFMHIDNIESKPLKIKSPTHKCS